MFVNAHSIADSKMPGIQRVPLNPFNRLYVDGSVALIVASVQNVSPRRYYTPYLVMLAIRLLSSEQVTPHPARVPMKCIGIAVHPFPLGEGKSRIARKFQQICGSSNAGLKGLCENSWIPAFAGMTGRDTAPKSSAVTPAEAGVQPGQYQTRVFTQTLKRGVTKPK